MANFFKSLFTGKSTTTENDKNKIDHKNFDILKFDGVRAMRIGKVEYAQKCFEQALQIQEEFETLNYLATTQIQLGQSDEAKKSLVRMTEIDPQAIDTFLVLANVCYMQDEYKEMHTYTNRIIALKESHAPAWLLLARAERGLGNDTEAFNHLTRAIELQEGYMDALLMRAALLLEKQQLTEAEADIETALQFQADEENALLLRARIKEAKGETEEAIADYAAITELNPFNEQVYLQLVQLLVAHKRYEEAIATLDEVLEINPECEQATLEKERIKQLE